MNPQHERWSCWANLGTWVPLLAKAVIGLGAAVLLAYLGQTPFSHSGCAGSEALAPDSKQFGFASVPITARASAAKPSCGAGGVGGAGSSRKPGAAVRPERAVSDDGRIILNLATVDDLVRLPGIGRKRAKAIVALRQRLGKFRRLRDLLRIRGIAYRSLRRLKPHVLLDRPAPVRVGQGGASSG